MRLWVYDIAYNGTFTPPLVVRRVPAGRAVRAFLEAAKQFFEPYLLQIHVGVRRYGLLLSIEREHSRDMAAGEADIDWIQ